MIRGQKIMNNSTFNIFFLPVWWYGEGLTLAWRHTKNKWGIVLRSTGLIIFLRNMTQPLYGDYTKSGRAISFFLRIFLLIFILFWTLLRLVFVLVSFFVHLLALPAIIIMIIYQLFPL